LRSEICDTDRCPFQRSLLGGETVTTFNIMAKDSSGTETPICINTSPLKNAKGDVVGVVETIRVVTPSNRLIEELREQRNKVQAVSTPSPRAFTVDRDGMLTSVNRTAEQILGKARRTSWAAGRTASGRFVTGCLSTNRSHRPRGPQPRLVITLATARPFRSACAQDLPGRARGHIGSGVHVSRPRDR
jgi:PAS domain-containing protein